MRKKFFFHKFFLNILILPILGFSQADPDCNDFQTYIKTYDSNSANEAGWNFLQTKDRQGFYISASINNQVAISFVDLAGNIIWTERTSQFDKIVSENRNLDFDSEGNLIGCANIDTPSSFVYKFDPTQKQFNWIRWVNTQECFFTKVIQLQPSANYAVFSQIITNQTLGCDAGFFELDRNTGELIQSKLLNLGSCESYADVQLYNNELYTCGRYNFTSSQASMRSAVSKLDLAGNELWSSTYLVNSTDAARQYGRHILVNNDGSITVFGIGDSNGTSLENIAIHVYNINLEGNLNWASYITLNVQSERVKFAKLLDDGYLIGGHHEANSNLKNFVMKLNLSGSVLWAKQYNIGSNSAIEDASFIGDFIYLIGHTTVQQNNQDILIIKANSFGEVEGDCDITDIEVSENRISNPYEQRIDINQISDDQDFNTINSESEGHDLLENLVCFEECEEEECNLSAGQLNLDSALVCSADSIKVTATDVLLMTDEIHTYILHDGTTTNIYDYNVNGIFINDETYPTNTQLFVSSIVAPINIEGQPNLNAECKDILLPGKPVIFLDPITIKENLVCDSLTETISLNFTISGGSPSFNNSTYIVTGSYSGSANADETITTNITDGELYSIFVTDDESGCQALGKIGVYTNLSEMCRDCNEQLFGTALIDECGLCLEPDHPDFNTSCIEVNELYIPNAFSPNGDDINDQFQLFSSNSATLVNKYIIYNRWAEKVYEANNFYIEDNELYWDGMHNNITQPIGVYVYYVEVEFPDNTVELYKGNVTLVR